MRILHLTRDYPPRSTGGLSVAVGGLVRALEAEGVTSRVVSFDAWRPASKAGGEARRAGDVLHVTSPAHHDAITAFIAEAGADVVHVHDGMLWDYAAAANKTVFTVHVAHGILRQLRGLEAPTQSETAQARAIAEANLVTVPSAPILDELGRTGHVVPFGIDAPTQSEDPKRGLLFAARLNDIKGIADLMAAMQRVRTNIGLRVAAGLPANPKAERRLRKRYGDDHATWLGWLDREGMGLEHRRASILVAPSWHETYGFSVLEAMAHGSAVIASDVAGHAELIEHGRTGWLVPPRDPQGLADAIDHLAADVTLCRSLGEAAAIEVAQKRTWSVIAPRWVEVYR